MKAKIIRALLQVWDVVWKAIVVTGVIICIISGGLSAASATGAIETNIKAIIDLPAYLDYWLDITAGPSAEVA